MPAKYKKSFRRKRRTNRRVPFTRKQFKALRKLVPLEKKYRDFNSSTSVSNSGYLSGSLNLVTSTDRDGQEIQARQLYFSYIIAIADTYNFVRVICWVYKPAQTASVEDPIDNTSYTAGLGIIAQYSLANQAQYKILYDKVHKVDVDNPVILRKVNLTRKVRGMKSYYTSSSSDVSTNKIYFTVISDSGATSHPSFEFRGRFGYYDS